MKETTAFSLKRGDLYFNSESRKGPFLCLFTKDKSVLVHSSVMRLNICRYSLEQGHPGFAKIGSKPYEDIKVNCMIKLKQTHSLKRGDLFFNIASLSPEKLLCLQTGPVHKNLDVHTRLITTYLDSNLMIKILNTTYYDFYVMAIS